MLRAAFLAGSLLNSEFRLAPSSAIISSVIQLLLAVLSFLFPRQRFPCFVFVSFLCTRRQATQLEDIFTQAVARHSGDPGVASGRHLLHARNPAPCAAAADGKKRMLTTLGVIAGQLGRQ